jgi:NAD(P)-dependent dehydrogenase (short-subunit alcohol dehydrogenase family)
MRPSPELRNVWQRGTARCCAIGEGRIAVVTGAGSGLGRALACELAVRGAQLALSDVDDAGLAETVRLAEQRGAAGVRANSLDVTDRAAVLAYADAVADQFGAVHLVINNAGVAFTGDIEELAFADIERVMDVDFWGVVNGTKAFLPHLIDSGDGHLVNISSLFGLLSTPSQGAYNAAKFAVRGFTEALRQEMLIAGHPVRVTCVHPGGVKTAIARNAGAVPSRDAAELSKFFDTRLARISPERAARTILRGVERGRARVLVGLDARLLDAFVRLTGSGYQRVVAAAASRSMPRAKASA